MLAESLAKNKSVVKVDLSFNSITNTGTLPIIKAIQQNTTIQQVLLFHNPLDNSAMNGVTDALKSELRGKTGAAGLPEDKRAIDALQKVRSLLFLLSQASLSGFESSIHPCMDRQ